ncbi:MAG TPA: HEAT repeat domain-containing protein [Gaiellaceae bacterium]|nr:HEAT repeat domain-containing protein [Gaiellaceae bacterium]
MDEQLKRAFKQGDLETLIVGLRDENAKIRNTAAFYLGRLGKVEAVPALAAALDDEDRFQKHELRGPPLHGLEDRLNTHDARTVRRTVLRALGEIGDETAIARLADAAHSDSDVKIRRAAARQLRSAQRQRLERGC